MGLTGVKNLISKSLGSTNKVNIAYAVIEGLRQQVPRKEWLGAKQEKKAEKAEKEVKAERIAKPAEKKPAAAKKVAAKKPAAKKPAAKKATSKKEDK
jgi:hypothetical protein